MAQELPASDHVLGADGLRPVRVTAAKTGAYNAVHGDVVPCNGTFTVTLPAASAATWVTVKNIGTGVVTVDGDGSETVDGAASVALTVQWESVDFVSTGTEWYRV